MGSAAQRASSTHVAPPAAAKPSWAGLTGAILSGGYELKELIAAGEEFALFRVRVLGDRELNCAAFFLSLPSAEVHRQVGIWESLRSASGSGLVKPFSSGIWPSGNWQAAYFVYRREDENLAGVLRERALDPGEARALFGSLAAGMDQLHQASLIHGLISPEHVMATGDEIQLSLFPVCPAGQSLSLDMEERRLLAPESIAGGRNTTIAADHWCLGATLFEALTARRWSQHASDAVAQLPPPFAAVITGLTKESPADRATTSQALAQLRGELPVVPVESVPQPVANPLSKVEPQPELRIGKTPEQAKAPVEASSAAPAVPTPNGPKPAGLNKPVDVPKPTGVPKPAPARAPIVRSPIERPDLERGRNPALVRAASKTSPTVERPRIPEAPAKEPRRSANNWLWGIGAIVLALLAFWLFRPTTPSGTVRTITPTPAQTRTEPPTSPAGSPSPSPVPPDAAPAASASSTTRSATHGDIWRVVLFTYNRQADAASKAQAIQTQHPALHTEVFAPNGVTGPFLVVVPGGDDKAEAERLRRQVVQSGMPHDAYIQNYTH